MEIEILLIMIVSAEEYLTFNLSSELFNLKFSNAKSAVHILPLASSFQVYSYNLNGNN
jgi:hypothetical protein